MGIFPDQRKIKLLKWFQRQVKTNPRLLRIGISASSRFYQCFLKNYLNYIYTKLDEMPTIGPKQQVATNVSRNIEYEAWLSNHPIVLGMQLIRLSHHSRLEQNDFPSLFN